METYQYFTLEDFVLDDDFRKWVLSPTTTSEESWNNFIKNHPEKEKTLDQARSIILSLKPVEEDVPSQRIDHLWQRINRNRNKKLYGFSSQLIKIAAVFVLAFLLGAGTLFIVNQSSNNYSEIYTEVNVPFGEKSEITLYDGTTVWLNSGTKLRFPVVFNSNIRKVYVEGEAFFDVAKNKKKPFVVVTGDYGVEVLGTRFNICAYPQDNEYYATLEEGKIKAYNLTSSKMTELNPSEQAVINLQTKNINLRKVNPELYTSWKDNILRFEDAEFSDLIKKMERWYDVKIEVKDIESYTKKYNMSIKTESLREMLKLISLTTPINYEINENKVFITRQ
ncbi:FecR family protein [Sunxiuqinia sp. A32]|uniref:FecR family protein n=1 Tax=Sunxiuqinia sp. A32 TaxID=3461496 RepID=UPI0040458F68